MSNMRFRAWITRHALSSGIKEVEIEADSQTHYYAGAWYKTREEAVDVARSQDHVSTQADR